MTNDGNADRPAVLIRRHGTQPRSIEPRSFSLSLESFGIQPRKVRGSIWLAIPVGWALEQLAPGSWLLHAIDPDIDQQGYLKLRARGPDGSEFEIVRPIRVDLDVRTTFDIERHPAPVRNSARVLGEVDPDYSLLAATYRLLPGPLRQVLFAGLYGDIVYIRAAGEHRGGLCSGLARWAGLRAMRGDDNDATWPAIRCEVAVLHGRQLTDRVIAWSFYWFLRGSPRAAYLAIRDEALETGESRRALDISVPRPWKRDLLASLVGEGHTVVPYRIRQHGTTTATIDVYDPNTARDPQQITLDLRRNRYSYRHKVSFDDHDIGMLAVPNLAYARQGTAYLATLGSLLWMVIRRFVR